MATSDLASKGKRRRPTINDVAKLAGVSIKTVSRVVNGVASVDSVLAENVRAAIATLGYRPNYLASRLKSGASTQTVAMIAKDLSSAFTVSAITGVESVARRHAAHLITASTPESASSREDLSLASDLMNRQVDGLIVMPTGGDYSEFSRIAASGTPVVFIDRDPLGPGGARLSETSTARFDTVTFDYAGGARTAAAALIADGHERIAHLYSTMEIVTMHERKSGVDQALNDAGLLLSQSPPIMGVMNRSAAEAATAHLLDATRNPPTAIFCANSEILIGVTSEVLRRGLPIAVSGFGSPHFSDLLPLPLTLIEADGAELGQTAATALYKRLRKPELSPQRIVLPTQLRATGSVPPIQ